MSTAPSTTTPPAAPGDVATSTGATKRKFIVPLTLPDKSQMRGGRTYAKPAYKKRRVNDASTVQKYDIMLEAFSWEKHVNVGKLRFKPRVAAPLTVETPWPGPAQEEVRVQGTAMQLAFAPKVWEKDGVYKLELTIEAQTNPALWKYCTEGSEMLLKWGIEHKELLFGADDEGVLLTDAEVKKKCKTIQKIKYMKWFEDENGKRQHSKERRPDNFILKIPMDDEQNPKIIIEGKYTKEKMALDEIPAKAKVDVLWRFRSIWVSADIGYGIKPEVLKLIVYPVSELGDDEMMPAELAEMARAGINVYTSTGAYITLPSSGNAANANDAAEATTDDDDNDNDDEQNDGEAGSVRAADARSEAIATATTTTTATTTATADVTGETATTTATMTTNVPIVAETAVVPPTVEATPAVASVPVAEATPVAPVVDATPIAAVSEATLVAAVSEATPVAPVAESTPVAPVAEATSSK